MANISRWRGTNPSMLNLQRDVEDLLEDFSVPHSFWRETHRLFDQLDSPKSLWMQLDRLMEDFDSPPALSSKLRRVFDRFSGSPMMQTRGNRGPMMTSFAPSIDLAERDNEYVLRVDLPGVRAKDIDLRVEDDGMLTIHASRRDEQNRQVQGYHYRERHTGELTRTLALPRDVDASHIETELRDGVLEVHVPRSQTMSRGRQIPVINQDEAQQQMNNGSGSHNAQPRA